IHSLLLKIMIVPNLLLWIHSLLKILIVLNLLLWIHSLLKILIVLNLLLWIPGPACLSTFMGMRLATTKPMTSDYPNANNQDGGSHGAKQGGGDKLHLNLEGESDKVCFNLEGNKIHGNQAKNVGFSEFGNA
ncbi:hypothetical protein GBA52_004560, partial [Prunus armeniaca]